jgi:DeoR family fructose operon transcriptional repressor
VTNLATEERLTWLGERLRTTGRVGIADAAAQLAVSEMTIRRDLKELEERGRATRVRGGALAVGPQAFADRRRTATRAKAAIAEKLARMVPTTGAVALDASSTVMRLASSMAPASDLLVVTNGPDTFAALQAAAGVRPVLTGGELEPRTGSLVGPLACRAASQVATVRLFTSCAALDAPMGATETCLEEAEVKRAMVAVAGEVVLAVDASKLGTRAVAVSIELGDVDVLVTELSPRDRRLAPYRKLVGEVR